VFVPISDDNPLKAIRFGYVTLAIIAINIIVFVAFQLPDLLNANDCGTLSFASVFGLIPVEFRGVGQLVIDGCPPMGAGSFPEPLTLISYMFLHGDFWHILFNMLFLWVFGDNVEDALGHARFLAFYVLAAVAGGLAHAIATDLLAPANRDIALIGASGAVAGVIAAYLLLYPRVRVWVLAFRFIPLRITAIFALGVWVATQFVMLLLPDKGPIAWWAHVGGVHMGAVLVLVLRRPGVELFNAQLVEAVRHSRRTGSGSGPA